MLWQEPSVSFSWDSQVCMLYMSFMWRDAFHGGDLKMLPIHFPPSKCCLKVNDERKIATTFTPYSNNKWQATIHGHQPQQ